MADALTVKQMKANRLKVKQINNCEFTIDHVADGGHGENAVRHGDVRQPDDADDERAAQKSCGGRPSGAVDIEVVAIWKWPGRLTSPSRLTPDERRT